MDMDFKMLCICDAEVCERVVAFQYVSSYSGDDYASCNGAKVL